MKKTKYSGHKKNTEIENNKFSVYTDLAIEVKEIAEQTEPDLSGGIKSEDTRYKNGEITVSKVEILNKHGEKAIGKPIGNYITIESQHMKQNDTYAHEEISEILAQNIGQLTKLNQSASILVVGLGNWNVTPDALGPKVVSKILVTRHIYEEVPEEIDESVRAVAAVAPGVMGITGIETYEIIKGIVDKIKPDLVIAIDALAARKTSRINTTIQLSDTGVSPGAGMGNKRKQLSKSTLGVPVIAIGVPTVVDAATLVNDTLERCLSELIRQAPKHSIFYEMIHDMDSEEKYGLILEILDPYVGNMFVTPKEVDAVIDRLSTIIANAINIAMHPGISKEDMNRYIV